MTFLLEGILVLMSLAFLSLAILACHWNNMPSDSDQAAGMEQAMKLGPTLYPILFAALVGRSLKGIGRFRAERGSRISTLWPLMNNKTMFDAFLSQWYLARFSAVASALVLLWALSPLGGQASLRLMYKTNITATYEQDLRYMDSGVLGNIYAKYVMLDSNDLGLEAQGLPLTMPALYQAALLQSLEYKQGPLDIWGNVKIPRLDMLNQSLADADGWINFTTPNSVESFSSLLGLPILNISRTGVVEFTVESVYVALAAPDKVTNGPVKYYPGNIYLYKGMNVTCPTCINWEHNDFLDPKLGTARQMLLYGEPFPQPNAALMANASYSSPRSIRFDAHASDYDLGTVTFFCPVTQHFIETTIRCTFGACRATRARPSTTDHRNQNVTSFDLWGTFALDMITSISNAKSLQVSSPSELFMNDTTVSPIRSGKEAFGTENFANLSAVEPHLLAERASMILNTALQIFMAPSGFTGDLPLSNLSIYGLPHIPADGVNVTLAWLNESISDISDPGDDLVHQQFIADAPFVAANTTATVTEFTEVYRADPAWVAVLILSSAVLVITGIGGMALGSYVRAPDVFDPLMGLTYNNPHLDVPGHHSTLSATERARLLRQLTVRLGDVQPYSEMGKISLGQTAEVKRLVRGRLYE
ncbi:hypothetical protein CONLIGDRAFT_645147 [Coniochaeta ligniaria NRRL 30616]|uniref:Uncharacterized protein n=1 Tax=Coniochaeta ligniaria NRRL 30616 TaxID=1408157 RepID=A0A1J7IP96_9PEZI|nr:hypothetical protein CONLIGDRAFT_645147 [Coniochaeta ligniaria NRRL 30616]